MLLYNIRPPRHISSSFALITFIIYEPTMPMRPYLPIFSGVQSDELFCIVSGQRYYGNTYQGKGDRDSRE